MLYAIAGVSGNTGKAAAEALLAAGEKIRVIVRDAAKGEPWRARGAEVAVADLGDAQALADALKGADAAYLLLPPRVAPGFRAYQLETGKALVEAVRQARPKHVVFLSSIGAQLPSGTGPIAGLYPVEQGLREVNAADASVNVTFLRAGYFAENLAASFGALEHGILPGFAPGDIPMEMIATQDIGRTAATLLREGGRGAQVVELAGPARSMNEAAAVVGAVLGRPIPYVQNPLDQFVPTMTGMGLPQDIAELYLEMLTAFATGKIQREAGNRHLQGTTALETVVRGLLGRAPIALKVGVLGSGQVAQVLARGFAGAGHEVSIGSREPAKLAAFGTEAGIRTGTFGEVAGQAELVVLAVKGTAAEGVVREYARALAGKVVIDVNNPIADAPPEDGIVRYFTGANESLMERLQAAAPDARFVKAWSSVGNHLMINPKLPGGRPTMFICGNDAAAKKQVTELLDGFGWDACDVGTVKGARAIEPLCQLWCAPGFLRNDWTHAFKMLQA